MRRLLLLALVAGCAAQTKPYTPLVVSELQLPSAAAGVHASGAVKAANALSVVPALNPPLRPLTDPRMLTVRIPTGEAFAYVRQSQGTKLVATRVANQPECLQMMESQVIALIELANYLESLPGGDYPAKRIDSCLTSIAPRLDVDYRVRELLPHGMGPVGSPQNLQGRGWPCTRIGRFYDCPQSALKAARSFLLSAKIRPLAAKTIPALLPDILDVRVSNGDLGAFCMGGHTPGAYCTTDGSCGGGKCQAGDFDIPPPMPFDKATFQQGQMSSERFITKPNAQQQALLDQAELRHAYASARVCDPSLPPGESAQASHLALEASALSVEQQMLFTIDPFVGLVDPRWSAEDRCALFAAVHTDGHMGWGEAVKAGDQGRAGIFAVLHSNIHRCLMRRSTNYKIRPLCDLRTSGNLIDYQSCPDMTCDAYLAQFKATHPNYRDDVRRMAGL